MFATTQIKETNRPFFLLIRWPIQGRVYFSADDGVHGMELWVSDGNTRGTRLLRDIRPGQPSSGPCYLTLFTPLPGGQRPGWEAGERLYFAAAAHPAGADHGAGGAPWRGLELWATDGTAEGTSRCFDETFNDLDLDLEALDADWPPKVRQSQS